MDNVKKNTLLQIEWQELSVQFYVHENFVTAKQQRISIILIFLIESKCILAL
jgi:hypothetical protein